MYFDRFVWGGGSLEGGATSCIAFVSEANKIRFYTYIFDICLLVFFFCFFFFFAKHITVGILFINMHPSITA